MNAPSLKAVHHSENNFLASELSVYAKTTLANVQGAEREIHQSRCKQ